MTRTPDAGPGWPYGRAKTLGGCALLLGGLVGIEAQAAEGSPEPLGSIAVTAPGQVLVTVAWLLAWRHMKAAARYQAAAARGRTPPGGPGRPLGRWVMTALAVGLLALGLALGDLRVAAALAWYAVAGGILLGCLAVFLVGLWTGRTR